MALSSEISERAKKYHIYRNGDKQYFGKDFVFNKRRVRTWDSFLQQVTNDIKFPEAVRSIRTPVGGTRVTNLDQLDRHEDKQCFVAVGNGKFNKDVRYMDLEGLNRRNNALSPRYQEVKPVEHSRIQVSGKIRKIPTDVMTIFVYSNGNELQAARRVTLTRQMLQNWNAILQEVTDRVGGLTTCLYTLDGQRVTNPAALQKTNFYVAVDKRFKSLGYGRHKPGFNTSPKQRRKLEPIMAPNRRSRKLRTGSDQTGTLENSVASSVSERSPKSHRSNPVYNRPPPNRKPHSKKKIDGKEKEEESIFHAKPVKHKRNTDKHDEIDYDKDQGGIFKAKGGNRETSGAEEIEDTRDTQVDLPIDQVEAEEIEDEDIEEENNKKAAKRDTKNSRSKQTKRAKSPPNSKRTSRSPSPAQRSPSPERRKSRDFTPEQRNDSPKQRTPTPKQRTPTPHDRTPTPQQRSPTPKQRTPTPADRTPTPKDRTPTPGESSRNDSRRSKTPNSQRAKSADDHNQDDAATKIQSNYRGYQGRKVVRKRKEQSDANEEDDDEDTKKN